MKKTAFLVLTVLLALTFTVSSFAYFGLNDFEPIGDVDQAELNLSLNSSEGDYATSDYLTTRVDWTPNRACDPDRTNALFVKGVEGNDTNCIKVVRSFTLFPDSKFTGDFKVSADIKPVKVTSFSGFLFDYADGSNSSTDVPHPNATIAEREKPHDYGYILYTGYGFTFLAGRPNEVRVFVNASKTGTVDYADIDLGFDTTAGWHNYAMYEDVAASRTYFYVDDQLTAIFDFAGESGTVFNGFNEALIPDSNRFFGNETGCVSFVGDDIEIYFDNLTVDNWTELPKFATDAKLVGASFDTLKLDGEIAPFQTTDGNASEFLNKVGRTIDAKTKAVQTVTIRGWAGFTEAITGFGYRIDEDKPVFGDFAKEPGDDVKAAGGEFASRFEIEVPTGLLYGKHRIVALVKFANGAIVELTPETDANCPDTSMFFQAKSTEILDFTDDGHGRCYDHILIDGEEGDSSMYDDVGEVNTVVFAGWAGFDGDVVEKYGYVVDNNEPVFNGILSNVGEEDPVRADQNGGENASRFKITVNNLQANYYDGEHCLIAVARLANGETYAIGDTEIYFTVSGNPAPTVDPALITPTPEVTDTPEPTATDAPTDVPENTQDNPTAAPTDAPDDGGDTKPEKKGCGGMVCGGAFLALAGALLIARKKH